MQLTLTIVLIFTSFAAPISSKLIQYGLFRSSNHVDARRARRLLDTHQPLYTGKGTHFAYVYVGTPPQRVSVIVDTGSHHLAFPCTGCRACGTHTDPYYDPTLSATQQHIKCGLRNCFLSQSYSEGSSWKATKMQDVVFVGGETVEDDASLFSVNMTFGCQTSETGLFTTQKENGIMGFSAEINTLPYRLYEAKKIDALMFSMCFNAFGGVLSLGGFDATLHKSPVTYAKLIKDHGWFTVHVKDVYLLHDGIKHSVSPSVPTRCNAGKGTIVDSGTTDTYLPASLASIFYTSMRKLTGMSLLQQSSIDLSPEQVHALPVIVFLLSGIEGSSDVEVRLYPLEYLEQVRDQKYEVRLFFTEASGGVLGANAMNGYDVVFYQGEKRVGFAPSDCMYTNQLGPAEKLVDALPPLECEHVPASPCSAKCLKHNTLHAYFSRGRQIWSPNPQCSSNASSSGQVVRHCQILCSTTGQEVTGTIGCATTAWSSCAESCTQHRVVAERDDRGACKLRNETRPCYGEECPRNDKCSISVNMRSRHVELASIWSSMRSDDVVAALAFALDIDAGDIRIVDKPIYAKGDSNVIVNIYALFCMDLIRQVPSAATYERFQQHLISSVGYSMLFR